MSTQILDQLLAVASLIQRDMARAFAGTPLTESRVAVLWTLQLRGPSTQREVAEALGVSAKNVSTLVDALEESGYVRRTPHATDRRAVTLTLTDTSTDLMATMQREHTELAALLVDTIDPIDLPVLERGITLITARLQGLVDEAAAADSDVQP